MGAKARNGTLTADELSELRNELVAMANKGPLSPELRRLAGELIAIEEAAGARPAVASRETAAR
jgi:hypothetical protein